MGWVGQTSDQCQRNLNIEDSELVLDTTIENPPPVFLVKKIIRVRVSLDYALHKSFNILFFKLFVLLYIIGISISILIYHCLLFTSFYSIMIHSFHRVIKNFLNIHLK